MKICQNCGHENTDSGKFCEECGTKLVEAPKFCPECGFSLLSGENNNNDEDYSTEYEDNSYETDDEVEDTYESEDEDYSYSEEDSDDYEEYVDEDEYEDDETTEEKIKKIVNKYIGDINKSGTSYSSAAIANPEYAQVIQNVRANISKDKKQSELYGFVDVTVFGKGKAGLLLTNDTLYLKEPGGSLVLPYYAMGEMYIKSNSLYFKNTKGYGKGLLNLDEVSIDGISYNIPALKDCLEEIYAII